MTERRVGCQLSDGGCQICLLVAVLTASSIVVVTADVQGACWSYVNGDYGATATNNHSFGS